MYYSYLNVINMMAKLNPKLTFAFRECTHLYWASIRDYSPNDYILITKGKDSVCYYLGDLKEIEKIRKKLLKPEFRKKLFLDLGKAINKLEHYNFKTNVSKMSLKQLQLEFKSVVGVVLNLAKIYFLTEEEYWNGLEKIVPKKELEQLSYLRFNAKKCSSNYWKYVGREILPSISNINKIKSDILVYTFDEILKLPKKLSAKVIANRKKGWGIIKTKNKRRLMTDKELLYYKKLIKQEHKLENKELVGLPVYNGEVIGQIKLVRSKDMNRNKVFDLQNKILVTEMTKPEIVPFLKGCLGIITDEGGLLCHASIVAREFKLPCIVGTKIATKVLKDNQKVKLDANTGKVILL